VSLWQHALAGQDDPKGIANAFKQAKQARKVALGFACAN